MLYVQHWMMIIIGNIPNMFSTLDDDLIVVVFLDDDPDNLFDSTCSFLMG